MRSKLSVGAQLKRKHKKQSLGGKFSFSLGTPCNTLELIPQSHSPGFRFLDQVTVTPEECYCDTIGILYHNYNAYLPIRAYLGL